MPSHRNQNTMKIAVTGTPGTGKTTVTEQLSSYYRIVHLTEYIKENDLGEPVQGVTEVDTEELKTKIAEEIDEENVVFEGHLAHHLEVDYCIILRCDPRVLEERLSERDYSDEKVNENLEAEALDVILSESVQLQENVLEIDTTDKTVDEVVEEIEKGLENKETGYGDVDWSDSFQALF